MWGVHKLDVILTKVGIFSTIENIRMDKTRCTRTPKYYPNDGIPSLVLVHQYDQWRCVISRTKCHCAVTVASFGIPLDGRSQGRHCPFWCCSLTCLQNRFQAKFSSLSKCEPARRKNLLWTELRHRPVVDRTESPENGYLLRSLVIPNTTILPGIGSQVCHYSWDSNAFSFFACVRGPARIVHESMSAYEYWMSSCQPRIFLLSFVLFVWIWNSLPGRRTAVRMHKCPSMHLLLLLVDRR